MFHTYSSSFLIYVQSISPYTSNIIIIASVLLRIIESRLVSLFTLKHSWSNFIPDSPQASRLPVNSIILSTSSFIRGPLHYSSWYVWFIMLMTATLHIKCGCDSSTLGSWYHRSRGEDWYRWRQRLCSR